MGIIVENTDSVEALNALLHEYAPYIIGRMGVPYREKKIKHCKRCAGRSAGHDIRVIGQNRKA